MSLKRIAAPLVPVMLAMAFAIPASSAQEASPAVDLYVHPSHIHAGSCAELDPAPEFPLNDVVVTEPGGAVEVATTTVNTTIDVLLADPHAIVVHSSAEDMATYIACGDLAGPVVDGQLIVGLYGLNDSNHDGIAVLEAIEDGGTVVTVYLLYTGDV
jgi:hypothetical protein